MNKTQSLTLLAARVLLALIFVAAGANKITDYAGTQAYMQSMGMPGVLLPLVIAALFHHNFADQVQILMFMKTLAIAGGLMALAAAGSGSYGLDARLDHSCEEY